MPRAALLALTLLAASRPAGATDYYVSPAGSDLNPGTSAAQAWATVLKVNATDFLPGDRVLFEGGATFDSGIGIYLTAADSGTAAAPVAFTSYGTGRATIAAGDRLGFYAYNAAGIEVHDLDFLVPPGTTVFKDGISFYTDLPGDVKLEHVRIHDVAVRGFGGSCIAVGAFNQDTGWRDVRVERVLARECGENGIVMYAQNPLANQEVHIAEAAVRDVSGVAGRRAPTGSGIVLGQVQGGSVVRSVASGNGFRSDWSNGPTGISALQSAGVRIAHNESHGNRSAGPSEGGGFALEDGTADSVLEYNYAHGNDGPGFALRHGWDTPDFSGNRLRFNLSQDDCRRTGSGAIEAAWRVSDTEVHNNTIFLSPAPAGVPAAIAVRNPGDPALDVAGLHFRNNIVMTRGGLALLELAASQLAGATDLRFEGNDWFAADLPFVLLWGATTYPSLAAWRAGEGQERIGLSDTGSDADPLLVAPGAGGTYDDAWLLESMTAYQLQAASPARDTGLDLLAQFGVDPGPADFWGTALPQGAAPDIGAHEASPVQPVRLLRARLSSVAPPTPPLATLFPFDPANPAIETVADPFLAPATVPADPASPLELYQAYPPPVGPVLLGAKASGGAAATFELR